MWPIVRSTPDARPGQPQTKKRKCGNQPAHQSLFTDVFGSRSLLCTIHRVTQLHVSERGDGLSCALCLTWDIRMGCCDYVRFALNSEHDKAVAVRWQRASIDVSFVYRSGRSVHMVHTDHNLKPNGEMFVSLRWAPLLVAAPHMIESATCFDGSMRVGMCPQRQTWTQGARRGCQRRSESALKPPVSRAITRACGGSATRCGGSGSRGSSGAARRRGSPGNASSASSIASFRQSRCYIRFLSTASTPEPEGGARCVSSARRDLCGLCLASAFNSAV